jgi:hypothetical protein
MKFKDYLNEAKIKIRDNEPLGIKGFEPGDLARAETIGGMTVLMDTFKEKGVAAMPGNRFKLGIINGELHVIWPPKGKLMLRVRDESNPGYYEKAVDVFKTAYKKYAKKIGK